jgi:hypothetical protein
MLLVKMRSKCDHGSDLGEEREDKITKGKEEIMTSDEH